jgi:hypothetical protein
MTKVQNIDKNECVDKIINDIESRFERWN